MKTTFRIVNLSLVILIVRILANGQDLRETINQQLNSSGLPYIANHVVDVDKSIGLVGGQIVEGEIENPYETLNGSLIFTAYNPAIQGPDTADWIVGVFQNDHILWRSDNLGNIRSAEIYGSLDLNLNGMVDIIVEMKEKNGQGDVSTLQIFSWNGASGTDITSDEIDPQTDYTGIYGGYHSYDISDIDGDGIMEIRSYPGPYEDSTNVHSWSWNGQKYGHWSNTPTTSFTSWLPAKNSSANVTCRVTRYDSLLIYHYAVKNEEESKRRIQRFSVRTGGDAYAQTNGSWQGLDANETLPGVTWKMIGLDNRNLIYPGEIKSIFYARSKYLPSINAFFIQSERGLMEINYGLSELWNDITNNSTSGSTISPRIPPEPFYSTTFIDTISLFIARSRDLGWITTQPIANKYLAFLASAKTALQANNIGGARTTLASVLLAVNQDSSSTLSSEAYALLRYNTEYLLEHLPALVTALDMLDTLRARLQQALSNTWLGSQRFQQELDRTIQTAKTNLASGDSIGCAEEIETFQQTIRSEYLAKPRHNDKRFITTEGYQSLYPYAQSIIDMVKRLPPRYDAPVADQLKALKSQIRIDAGNGLLGTELLIRNLEKTVEMTQKQLQWKDSSEAASQLMLFRHIVRQTYELTKKRFNENLYVKPGGYVSLYYRAGYILEKLPPIHGRPMPEMEPELEKEIQQMKGQEEQ